MATEKRLIDANALIAILEEIAEEDESIYFHLDEITQEIFDAPTVYAVEVVRCKNCARGELYSNRPSYIFCMEHHRLVEKDDYCSYGEREVE